MLDSLFHCGLTIPLWTYYAILASLFHCGLTTPSWTHYSIVDSLLHPGLTTIPDSLLHLGLTIPLRIHYVSHVASGVSHEESNQAGPHGESNQPPMGSQTSQEVKPATHRESYQPMGSQTSHPWGVKPATHGESNQPPMGSQTATHGKSNQPPMGTVDFFKLIPATAASGGRSGDICLSVATFRPPP